MPYIIHHMQCFMHCHGNSSSWVVIGCDPVPLDLTWNFIRNSAQWLEKELLLCIFLVFAVGSSQHSQYHCTIYLISAAQLSFIYAKNSCNYFFMYYLY